MVYTVAGKGTALIESATDNAIADPTTTKQVLTEASGLLVEASDSTSKFYLHNHLGLPPRPTTPARSARSDQRQPGPARRPRSRP